MSSLRATIFGVCIVVMLAAAAFSITRNKPSNKTQLQQLSKNANPSSTPTVEQTAESLLQKTTLHIPQVEQASIFSQEKLDKGISNLILPNATNVDVRQIKYVDGTSGYKISYFLEDEMVNAYQKLQAISAINKWKGIGGSRANAFAYIDLQQPGKQARIALSVDSKNLLVEITTIEANHE